MIIVGITGKAGAGKDTIADRLVTEWGFKKLSFAAPLKAVLLKIDPILGMDIFQPGHTITLSEALKKFGGEDGVKKLYPSYRKYLQKLGTEGIRAIDEDFWIKAAIKEIDKEDRDARLVFTDCRFPNEADLFHYRLPGNTTEVWQVDRPAELRTNGQVEAHISEQHVGYLGEDIKITNDSSLDDLNWTVDSLVRDLLDVEAVKLAA